MFQKEIDGIIKNINKNMLLYTDKTPHITSSLSYLDNMSPDGNWTGSFWFGMVILAATFEKNPGKYSNYLASFKEFYTNRVRYGYKDHDLGFLYQLYAVDAYRLTNDYDYIEMAETAAKTLYLRYNKNGGFIRAWGFLSEPERQGKIITDCMMNLPLMFAAEKITGEKRYYDAAVNHAYATLNNIRADGSVYHTYNFDEISGKPLNGENEGGYADESCWSRGLAWAIYGYFLAWYHTKNEKFLEASKKTADYFVKNVKKGELPRWDFLLDDESDTKIDTSAATIASCAFYWLHKITGDEKYKESAIDMLSIMINKHSHTFDDNAEILLDSGMTAKIINGVRDIYQDGTIWGDYFYFEALLLWSGNEIMMWTL